MAVAGFLGVSLFGDHLSQTTSSRALGTIHLEKEIYETKLVLFVNGESDRRQQSNGTFSVCVQTRKEANRFVGESDLESRW